MHWQSRKTFCLKRGALVANAPDKAESLELVSGHDSILPTLQLDSSNGTGCEFQAMLAISVGEGLASECVHEAPIPRREDKAATDIEDGKGQHRRSIHSTLDCRDDVVPSHSPGSQSTATTGY